MLKVRDKSFKSVKVLNKFSAPVWIPTSQVKLDDTEENVMAARKWIIEEKHLDTNEVAIDETIGITITVDSEAKGTVYANNKTYERKLYWYKGASMYVFNFKANIYAFPYTTELGKKVNNQNGLIYIGVSKDGVNFEKQVEEVMEKVAKVEEAAKEIEAKLETEPVDFTKPVKHSEYETIKTCVEENIPVYLYGPAGSGKNFVLQMIAEELNLEFYFTNSVQQEYKITGFIDAGGNFHETEFYKAFTNGGLFFLDEMDASIPEVLVLLNAAIANGYFEFPNGKVFANPDFRVVAAGNTIGSGADEQYTGRLVLDQATLDRFVSIEFNYDRNIEMSLAKGNEELVEFIRAIRARANETGIRATFSYRCIISIAKLEGKMALGKVLKIAVFKGMDQDTINTLKNTYSSNKYYKAMDKMVA